MKSSHVLEGSMSYHAKGLVETLRVVDVNTTAEALGYDIRNASIMLRRLYLKRCFDRIRVGRFWVYWIGTGKEHVTMATVPEHVSEWVRRKEKEGVYKFSKRQTVVMTHITMYSQYLRERATTLFRNSKKH